MKFFPTALLSAALALPALAVKVGEKPDTPELPDAPYVVHDGTRPQPRVVDNAGAVEVKAPADAIVLFDGSNLDAFRANKDGAVPFKLEEGLLIAAGGSLRTKQEFRDIQLHFEWRVPAGRKVDGQSGGNSGVFLMDRYEVQVLQSNNNQTYPDGQAGALYGQKPPLVNATTKQGDWQSYDVFFKAPRYVDGKMVTPATVTILHNGVLLHHAQPYLGPTSHKKLARYPQNHPDKAPLRWQYHSDPIAYRNIWVRELTDYDEGAK